MYFRYPLVGLLFTVVLACKQNILEVGLSCITCFLLYAYESHMMLGLCVFKNTYWEVFSCRVL